MSLLLVVMALAVQGDALVGDVCGELFYWEGDVGAVQVDPQSDLVRLELTPPRRDGDGGADRGRLVLSAGVAGLIGEVGPWAPPEAGLSLTPPRVPLSRGRLHTRIRFGADRRARTNRSPRLDFYWLEGGDQVEAWTGWSRLGREGPDAVRRFRSGGSLTVDLIAPDSEEPDRIVSSARFDWSDAEVLIARARTHYDGCPAT
ncbi:hypothetical protein [Brevundimonas sp.]|uniref:hypothetical protein n=1 Tax=Brevundimonas sp. TaxID=1871086 RepID=UPI001DB1CB80|nr:hypothetical protein [Brevundimonas sp.]MBA3999117.1 hypothetical protein [Brevundimonas sp.]